MLQRSIATVVLASWFGVILESYDFALYAYLAPVMSALFFPSHDARVSVMLAYAVFTVGFLARPLGAILFGHFGDKLGRQKMVVTSIVLMSVPTVLIGLLPTYAQVGVVAPLSLIVLRILQGISTGGEFTGCNTFVLESSPAHLSGFTTALVWSGTGVGLLSGSLVASWVTTLNQAALSSWGWRLPFLFGAVTGVIGYYFRKNAAEPMLFQSLRARGRIQRFPLLTACKRYKMPMLYITMLYSLSAVITYIVYVFMPTYAEHYLQLSLSESMSISSRCMAIAILLLPIGGLLSDWFGRRNALLISTLFWLVASIPAYQYLQTGGARELFHVLLIFTVFAALYQGALTAAALEILPAEIRYSVAALGYNLSYSIFGGTAPLVAMSLVQYTSTTIAPGIYLTAMALINFPFVLTLHTRTVHYQQDTAAAAIVTS